MPDFTHTLKACRRSVIEVERAHDLPNPTEDHINRRIANNLMALHHWGALEQHYAETADADRWRKVQGDQRSRAALAHGQGDTR